jgi:hypothetical protein
MLTVLLIFFTILLGGCAEDKDTFDGRNIIDESLTTLLENYDPTSSARQSKRELSASEYKETLSNLKATHQASFACSSQRFSPAITEHGYVTAGNSPNAAIEKILQCRGDRENAKCFLEVSKEDAFYVDELKNYFFLEPGVSHAAAASIYRAIRRRSVVGLPEDIIGLPYEHFPISFIGKINGGYYIIYGRSYVCGCLSAIRVSITESDGNHVSFGGMARVCV